MSVSQRLQSAINAIIGDPQANDDLVALLNSIGGAAVTEVTASSPLTSSEGITPNISLTGVVAAINGGTGLSAVGSSGNILTSNGSIWVSSTPVAKLVSINGNSTPAQVIQGDSINTQAASSAGTTTLSLESRISVGASTLTLDAFGTTAYSYFGADNNVRATIGSQNVGGNYGNIGFISTTNAVSNTNPSSFGMTMGDGSNDVVFKLFESGTSHSVSFLTLQASSGNVIVDPAAQGNQLIISNGASGKPGIAFASDNTTGLWYEGSTERFVIQVQGTDVAFANTAGFNPGVSLTTNLGAISEFWNNTFTKTLSLGPQVGAGKQNYINFAQNNRLGIGYDALNSNDLFMGFFDNTYGHYALDGFDFFVDNQICRLSAGSDTGLAFNAWHLELRGGPATTGNNNGGDVLITGGPQAGSGLHGSVYLPNTTGSPAFTPTAHSGFSPIYVDPTNSKIWMYNGSAWISVILS